MKRACLFLLLLAFIGCHEAGTWEDNSENFERIFHETKPEGLVIVHSWYWQSPYFATEHAYYIQIQPHVEFQKGLFQYNQLKQPATDRELASLSHNPKPKPDWFLPKPLDQYEVWIYVNNPTSHFRLFIDKATRDLFLSDYQ